MSATPELYDRGRVSEVCQRTARVGDECGMSSRRSDVEWERFGSEDPYFGVVTDDRFHASRLDADARVAFFQSGEDHVDHVLEQVDRHLTSHQRFERALDFGCGVGRLVVPLAKRVGHVTGTDVSRSMLAEAQKNCDSFELDNVSLVQTDDEMLNIERGTFDFVHSFIVLQHIEPRRGVAIIRRLVDLLAIDGVAMLHLTYAKSYRVKRTKVMLVERVPYLENLLSAARGTGFRRPPQMHMNPYPLSEVFPIIQKAGVRDMRVEFSDHDGELGVLLYFQKTGTPIPPVV